MLTIDDIRALVANDMQKVNQMIVKSVHSPIALIEEIGEHIINSGGKRLRPLLVLLAAKAFGYEGEHHHLLAAIIEFIHTATLLHDDVVDNSTLRRGKETANAIWGNEASVLVGDFVYSRSFQMMVSIQNLTVMNILANATNKIAEGEVLQLLNRHDASLSEERYMEVVRYKTATLFEAATQLGAVICNRSAAEIQAMSHYGLHLGMAFQLVDDALDYSANSDTLGKNIGDDLAEGKPTLPLIYALQQGTPAQQALIVNAIKYSKLESLNVIQQTIESTDAIAYTYRAARAEADAAISALTQVPASKYKQALEQLAHFAVERTY